mmetsp:Transcript_14961/g.50169  ORF Transcript_14961/g.50169 Transcript_14961/m.50169 type:complete len:307 (-) Transcript_14961:197-1117(-)
MVRRCQRDSQVRKRLGRVDDGGRSGGDLSLNIKPDHAQQRAGGRHGGGRRARDAPPDRVLRRHDAQRGAVAVVPVDPEVEERIDPRLAVVVVVAARWALAGGVGGAVGGADDEFEPDFVLRRHLQGQRRRRRRARGKAAADGQLKVGDGKVPRGVAVLDDHLEARRPVRLRMKFGRDEKGTEDLQIKSDVCRLGRDDARARVEDSCERAELVREPCARVALARNPVARARRDVAHGERDRDFVRLVVAHGQGVEVVFQRHEDAVGQHDRFVFEVCRRHGRGGALEARPASRAHDARLEVLGVCGVH